MRSLPLVGLTYPSASALAGAAVCVAPWSLGLPREDTAGVDAERGRALHAGSEMLARGQGWIDSLAKALPNPPSSETDCSSRTRTLEYVEMAIREDMNASEGRGVWHVEQGVQWRPGELGDEARLVERQPGEEAAGWFAGTADLAYVRADGVLVVVDWKFGPRQRWTAERAADHWQGWSLALFLVTALGISAARPDDVVARFEARYVDEEGVYVDAVDITQGELDAHAVELGKLARRIESGEGPRVGAACGKCKARASCPALAAVGSGAAALLFPSSASELWHPPQSEDAARRLHWVIGAVETWLERAREYRRAYVLTHPPISLGNGQELAALGRAKRALLRTPEALAVVEEVVPGAVTIETTTKRTTGIGLVEDAARASVNAETFGHIASAADRRKAIAAARKAAEEAALSELAARGVLVEAGTVYAIGVRRSDGSIEVVDRVGTGEEE